MSNQTSSQGKNASTKLENSTYNIIRALEKDADFLYSTVGQYVKDAEQDNRPDLVNTWNTIRQDKERHVQMLRDALTNEAKEAKLK